MNPDTTAPKTINLRLVMLLVLLLFAILIIYLISARSSPKNELNNTGQPPSPQPTAIIRSGQLMIKTTDELPKNVGNQVSFDIVANSEGKDIVGYDLVVGYDVNNWDVVNVNSALADFNLFKNNQKNGLIVTGLKNPSNKTNHVWQGTKIATLIFRPKVKGNYVFELLTNTDKEVTKMIDVNSKAIYPNISQVSITVN